ncbi:MAG: DUF167 domain-containing protein [Alphaproteobacteria bacterium]|nr:DUF167 domain-containing protein [Alphaproteobacteria bacterium]MBU0796329.1 DUF167 domain-containing protein [Alphaproteobacteria bacterium]MBU0889154.1 DUF167 domain-containing protein [Alphaproteobacteria bacterium]MBU1812188.1 DUF167 domain-containing protein [Alphaproteobacteria bacterium]MBU2089735.1 DUF167 domain-containing protein [Alphaproteobacteria bacterium]
MSLLPFSACDAGVRARIRLTPGSSADRIQGLVEDEAGASVLKIAVTAIPEDGKANAALVKLLAKSWKLPKSDLRIVLGLTDRRKTVEIAGDSDVLMRRLTDWLETIA